jgi:peptide/nickel transport system permease protein
MLHGMLTALLRGLAVVLGVVTLTFFLLHLAPGDPVRRLLGPAAEPAQIEAARHTLGLDRPLPVQYLDWIGRAGRGDFGSSIAHGRPAAELLGEAWPATALLVLLSILLSWTLGIAIGALQANTRRPVLDGLTSALTVALNAMPGYWLGMVLVMLFTYQLGWLPAFGAAGVDAEFLRRQFLVVGNDEEGLIELFAQGKEQLVQFAGIGRIEVAGGLIGKDNGGPVDQCPGYGYPLLLAAR